MNPRESRPERVMLPGLAFQPKSAVCRTLTDETGGHAIEIGREANVEQVFELRRRVHLFYQDVLQGISALKGLGRRIHVCVGDLHQACDRWLAFRANVHCFACKPTLLDGHLRPNQHLQQKLGLTRASLATHFAAAASLASPSQHGQRMRREIPQRQVTS